MIRKRIVFYAFGYNKYAIGPNHQTIHAECDAINKLKYTNKSKKVDVLVYRISNNGKDIMLGKPCKNCQRRLYYGLYNKGYFLNRVYYTIKGNEPLGIIKNSEL